MNSLKASLMSALSRVRVLNVPQIYFVVNTDLDLVSVTVSIDDKHTKYPYLYVRYVPVGNYSQELDYYWEHIVTEYEYMNIELMQLDDPAFYTL